MQETLNKINVIIDRYNSGEYLTTDKLRTLLRELSICHYHLTSINIDAYNDWTAIIYNRDKNSSVAAAKVKADALHPELRQTRKIMEAVKHIMFSLQQEISILKNE